MSLQEVLAPPSLHEASIHPTTGLESRRRSSHEEPEPGRRSLDAGPGQLISYTRRRRKVLSPASATTSSQLADIREVAEDASGEDNGDTGSSRDVLRGSVFGYFPADVSFAAIHEHRTSIDVDKGGESSLSPPKRRRRDVASSVTTNVEIGTNCNKKPASERKRESTDVQFVWETYYPNVPCPEDSGENGSTDCNRKPEPKRQRDPSADFGFIWETYCQNVAYPEVMKMSWGPWSRSQRGAISESAYSIKLQKSQKKTHKARLTFPSTASPDDFAQMTPGSRLIYCPNPLCEYHVRAIAPQCPKEYFKWV